MKVVPRLLYLVVFIGLAIVAVLALNRAFQSSAATVLVRAAFVAAVFAAPGLVFRKLWPLSIVLLPIGCYLLIRTTMPLPAFVEGAGSQYAYYTEQLRLGLIAYKSVPFPLPIGEFPELRLLIAFVVYWVVAAAAFLALGLRRPLPGMAVLLVIVGMGLTVDQSVRLLWPALLFLVLSGSLFVLSRAIEREGWRLRNVLAGSAVGVVASLLALGLLVSTPSVVAKPWQDWRAWDPFGGGGTVYTFNWLQNYPRLLDPANTTLIMTVDSPSPSYWRASALDTFTGTAWVTSRAFLVRIDPSPATERSVQERADFSEYSSIYDIPDGELMPGGMTAVERFEVQGARSNYLFAGGDPHALGINGDVTLRMNDMGSLRTSEMLEPTFRYTVEATIPEVEPADLVGLGTDYPEDLDGYLTLPFSRVADIGGPDKAVTWQNTMSDSGPDSLEWVDLYELNQSIIGDATDPYEMTLRIERHLRRFYTYSIAPPISDFSSPYAAFLFETRTGYCQHFAGAMALLLRYNSIPARVAVGFATGESETEGVYQVSANNAHAWVEVYFPTVGWVAFDPTPGRNLPVAGASSSSPGFINPFVDDTGSGGGTVDTLPPDFGRPDEGGGGSSIEDGGGPGWLSRADWLPWVAAIVLLIVGWPVTRALWRRRGLHKGTAGQRLQASLGLLRADLSAYRVPVRPADTLEDVFLILKTRLDLEPDQAFIERCNAVLFGDRNARMADVVRAEALRRKVRARLREHHGWSRTAFAWYGVPRLSLGGGRRA